MLRKSFALVLVMVALISVGVLVAGAQADDTQPTPSTPCGMNMGEMGMGMMGMHRMMGYGFGGGMMGNDHQSMITAAAEALGLEPTALVEAIQAGQTLSEIAESQSVELQTVYDAMVAEAETHMAEMVASGFITQAQADEHLTWMRDNIAEMPMFSGMGMQDGMPGMMGMMHMGQGMMGGNRMGRGMGWNG